jgi:hypothetical protein
VRDAPADPGDPADDVLAVGSVPVDVAVAARVHAVFGGPPSYIAGGMPNRQFSILSRVRQSSMSCATGMVSEIIPKSVDNFVENSRPVKSNRGTILVALALPKICAI